MNDTIWLRGAIDCDAKRGTLEYLRIVPILPTAQPVETSENESAFKGYNVLDACRVQVAPPLTVERMTPRSPQIHPLFRSRNETDRRCEVTPEDCGVQVVPPSVVRMMAPKAPTAHPIVLVTNFMLSKWRGVIVDPGWRAQDMPPFDVVKTLPYVAVTHPRFASIKLTA